jgi:hypothetical protein
VAAAVGGRRAERGRAREADAELLNFQPVVPFAVSRSTNVILRVILPLTSQPSAQGSTAARINGIGDTVATAFFSPSKASRIIWGVGASWRFRMAATFLFPR